MTGPISHPQIAIRYNCFLASEHSSSCTFRNLSKYHNFKNLVFCDVTLKYSIKLTSLKPCGNGVHSQFKIIHTHIQYTSSDRTYQANWICFESCPVNL